MQTLEIETFKAASKGFFARPANSAGTMGWAPFPWDAIWGKTPKDAFNRWCERHENKIRGTYSPVMATQK